MIDLSQYEDRYSAITLGQSMKIGWEWMVSVLFRPFTLKMLILLGLLALFANMQVGGGCSSEMTSVRIIFIFFQLLSYRWL